MASEIEYYKTFQNILLDSDLIFRQTTEIFVSSNMSLKISEGHLDQKLPDSQTMVK